MMTAFASVYGRESGNFPLLARLREFHVEILRVKEALRTGGWPPGEGEENPDIVLRVHYRLRRVLERQGLAANREGGGYGAGLYHDAQYVMAALADEILLHLLEWEGRERWRDHLLEMAMFQSQIAGERIFDRLDEMLAAGANAEADLAAVYLVALSLGFRGKYRGIDDGGALRSYRQGLHALIRRAQPLAEDPNQPLFEEAYAHTIAHGVPVRLPHTRPWFAALGLAVLAYLIAQGVVWHQVSAPVAAIVQHRPLPMTLR